MKLTKCNVDLQKTKMSPDFNKTIHQLKMKPVQTEMFCYRFNGGNTTDWRAYVFDDYKMMPFDTETRRQVFWYRFLMMRLKPTNV